MNSRFLAYHFSRYHQHQRRVRPLRHYGVSDAARFSRGGQSDWAAFVRLAIVLALTGCAIAALHWAHQS